ncbi:uncharacterized protein LOC123566547 isoform X1 [Mercenaria mercenaria]|uniref:uncharacterized protein LOC123566547 isoform X1 n=1 Tax=Mercenaria mercenaria TaxID=6596 RepID=UPI00234EE9BD|nr:uncharacterized protein LOC123566547 isoform X1 [Mercenaria mercenaria]
MSLRKLKLFKIIQTGTTEAILKALMDYLKSGKDPNIRDDVTGGTLLHLIVEHGDRFITGQTVSGVYMLVCKDIDIDARDNMGETGLHKAMRIKGGYRIILALMRCGADTAIKNNNGLDVEQLLEKERPDGWEENLHWYRKLKPGLWCALNCENPDRKLVETLLKNWCRVTTVKQGKVMSMKFLVENDIHKVDLLQLLEKYENTNELALATTAGMGFIVRMWVKQGIISNMDVNTKDYCYQYHWSDAPVSPRPIIAASWESNNFEAVDVIMELKPDTRVLWTPDHDYKNPPKPVFFQVLCGLGAPYDEKITMRVLKGSDLTARDSTGQTILHVAVSTNQSDSIFRHILQCGVDLSARDCQGRTARDLAEKSNRPKYVRLIDEFVIKLVKEKKFETIEKLILQNYDHILDMSEGSRSMTEIAKKSSTKNIYEIVKLTAPIQAYVRRVFQSVDDGATEDLRKLLNCKRYGEVRDRCGRTVLHRAILKRREDIILYLLEEFPVLINSRDSLDRTPLHYAQLFIENADTVNRMTKLGADPKLFDANGLTTNDYKKDVCGNQKFQRLQKEVKDFDLNVYLSETDFETTFKSAISSGDLETVKSLVTGLKSFGDVSRYSSTLFDCLDSRAVEIAKFLIVNGFQTDVYKQYNKCDPNDPMCAMMECGHSMTSLKERAQELKLEDISRMIEAASNGKLQLQKPEEVTLPGYGLA